MLAASKVKMSGSEKKKRKGTQAIFFFCGRIHVRKSHNGSYHGSWCTYDIFFIKRVTRKFHVTTTSAKKCNKKCIARAKLLFLPIDFFRSCHRRFLALHVFIFFFPSEVISILTRTLILALEKSMYYLNSNFALTLGYLSPVVNNPAQGPVVRRPTSV